MQELILCLTYKEALSDMNHVSRWRGESYPDDYQMYLVILLTTQRAGPKHI